MLHSTSLYFLKTACCRNLFLLTVIVSGLFLSSCQNESVILYGKTFEQVKDSAQKAGKAFCIVLSQPDCPPCTGYLNTLGNKQNRHLFGDAIFNIVDISQPENRWYTQWICHGGTPITCIFSSEGTLKAVVPGASASVLQCIQSALKGDVQCADYFYDKHYPIAEGKHIALLNSLLACRQDLNKGVDIGDAIDTCLRQTDYPYPVYLKCLNSEKQGRHDEAVYLARQLLKFDDVYYYYIYNDLFTEVKAVINPNYTPEEDAVLLVVDKLNLDNCKVGRPEPFSLKVTNTGMFRLLIRDIRVSCSCLELLGPKQFMLDPGESANVELEFTAETAGDVYREVIFISNAAEAVKQVKIKAHAE